MSYDEFRTLVEKMRAAQKHYFRHRDNLIECKGLESLVDEALAAHHAGPGLFDSLPEDPA